MKKVAIGGGQGFWGDSPDAAIHMIRNADIQYMGCDYLAELTLSIMAKQQLKDPTKGFAPDFTTRILKEAGKEAWDKHIKICTNAGGMNINGCVDGIRQWAEGNSMSGYKIGYVTGDNIKDKIPQLLKDGWTFPNFDYDGNFNDILDKIYNCNVYIGHEGIEGCLAEGADVVITGRAADSALFLAPLKYEFGWAADDWDNLARGIMAGHLLECGGQGAGGNYMYDWRNVPRMDELGFPIAELTDDTFEITKAPDCGGIICEQSCKEQFLYEVHDPANYLTPDVNVDISHATITQVGDNRVRIGGVKGKPRPDTLKLCVGYHKGWKTVSMLSFAWPDAYEKAEEDAAPRHEGRRHPHQLHRPEQPAFGRGRYERRGTEEPERVRAAHCCVQRGQERVRQDHSRDQPPAAERPSGCLLLRRPCPRAGSDGTVAHHRAPRCRTGRKSHSGGEVRWQRSI